MIQNKRIRRALALSLAVFGALLMFLAPEVWLGGVLLALGVLLEIVGISLERGAEKRD